MGGGAGFDMGDGVHFANFDPNQIFSMFFGGGDPLSSGGFGDDIFS